MGKADMSLLTVSAIFLSYTTIVVLGAPVGECCVEKSVGETVYTLVKVGDTMRYGCQDNCIYQDRDIPGNMFCFKEGSLPVHCFEDKGNTTTPVDEGKTDSPPGQGNTDSQIEENCFPSNYNTSCQHVSNTKIVWDFYDNTTQKDFNACWNHCIRLQIDTPNDGDSFNGWVSGKDLYFSCTEEYEDEEYDGEDKEYEY